jgi:hypothetical protein
MCWVTTQKTGPLQAVSYQCKVGGCTIHLDSQALPREAMQQRQRQRRNPSLMQLPGLLFLRNL